MLGRVIDSAAINILNHLGAIAVHELSIAQSLLAIVVDEAERHGVSRLKKVGITVGAFSAVVPDALRFCWDLIVEDTVAAHAELLIEEVPMKALCHDCQAEISMDEPVFECPQCQSTNFEVTQGQELMVAYIETED